jgi:hypothetical protein
VFDALVAQGRALVALDRAPEAVERLERAHTGLTASKDASASARAEAKLELAKALWAAKRDRDRARTLATEARTLVSGGEDPEGLAEIEAWLADHG